MGTLPAFLAAWGPVDMSFGSGQGVKCYHSEHLYGELWHRAFTVSPDTPLCEYLVSFGANVEASGAKAVAQTEADASTSAVTDISKRALPASCPARFRLFGGTSTHKWGEARSGNRGLIRSDPREGWQPISNRKSLPTYG